MSNKAAWITDAKAYPLKVDTAPMPKAGPGEVVVKNKAIAINPVDWKIQALGIIIEKYPYIPGCDVAGEVYEVGPGVTNFKKGDRVMGHAISLLTRDNAHSGFQLYSACNVLAMAKIPDSLDYASAAVVPLGVSTAATILFKKETLGLPFPSTTPQPSNKSILVWGGSSSMGASAVQLAAAAGVTVVSVASQRNLESVRTLGAKHVFDYNSATVVDDIIGALEGTEFVGIADCIGEEASVKAWTPVYEKLGGRYGTVDPWPVNMPEGLQGGGVFACSVVTEDKAIGEAVWQKFLPEALEKGTYKAKPDPIVVGTGLESLQAGLDRWKKGVSNAKIVVTV